MRIVIYDLNSCERVNALKSSLSLACDSFDEHVEVLCIQDYDGRIESCIADGIDCVFLHNSNAIDQTDGDFLTGIGVERVTPVVIRYSGGECPSCVGDGHRWLNVALPRDGASSLTAADAKELVAWLGRREDVAELPRVLREGVGTSVLDSLVVLCQGFLFAYRLSGSWSPVDPGGKIRGAMEMMALDDGIALRGKSLMEGTDGRGASVFSRDFWNIFDGVDDDGMRELAKREWEECSGRGDFMAVSELLKALPSCGDARSAARVASAYLELAGRLGGLQ